VLQPFGFNFVVASRLCVATTAHFHDDTAHNFDEQQTMKNSLQKNSLPITFDFGRPSITTKSSQVLLKPILRSIINTSTNCNYGSKSILCSIETPMYAAACAFTCGCCCYCRCNDAM
jgi:hypothetical protein